jgi:hypothetical protein
MGADEPLDPLKGTLSKPQLSLRGLEGRGNPRLSERIRTVRASKVWDYTATLHATLWCITIARNDSVV